MAEILKMYPSGKMAAMGGILKISTNKYEAKHRPHSGRFGENCSPKFVGLPGEKLVVSDTFLLLLYYI